MYHIAQSVGIDVSKETLDVHILSRIGQTIISSKVNNTSLGINHLEKILKENKCDKHTPIVIESTGDYHILLVLTLAEHGWDVRLINPIISGKQSKASIRKAKTDKIDAQRLAELGIQRPDQLPKFTGSRQQVMIGKKINLIHTLEKKRQSMKLSLWSIKTIGTQLALEQSEGIKAVDLAIKTLEEAITKLKQEIVDHYRGDPDLKRLEKISGISIETGSLVLSQIKGRHFKSKSELVAFCGLDIAVRESGKYKGVTKLSKRGNAYLRHVLFQIAWGLKMHQEKFKRLYDYYKQQGRHYYACINILARKFLHILFGMLKTQTDFNPALIIIPA